MTVRKIRHLRWWIGGTLFACTIINYIDRQTLSALAPILKKEYSWTNTDFATILISFRIAYTLMQGIGGRLLDWLGTRRGLSLTVLFYSAERRSRLPPQGIAGFRFFRFLLGAGEGPNFPGGGEGRLRMVPRQGARVGRGHVRQRHVDRRSRRAVSCPLHLSVSRGHGVRCSS